MAKKQKTKQIERRAFTLEEIRAQETEPGVGMKLIGYAAVYETEADLRGCTEKISRGAFDKSLGGDIRALFNHNPSVVLGRSSVNTLRMASDERGLKVEIDLPETQAARDIYTLVQRGDISEMSIGMFVIREEWEDRESEYIRTILEAELMEVSVVTFAVYEDTEIAVRSMELFKEQRNNEKRKLDEVQRWKRKLEIEGKRHEA